MCYELQGILHMRAQVSEVIVLTQLTRKLQLTLRLLVHPSIVCVLVIITTILIFIPTLTISCSFLLFLLGCWLPFGLDVCIESTLVDWVG